MTPQSIRLQGEQCVCEQTSTSHDGAQCTFTVQPQCCLSQPLQSVEWKWNHKRLNHGVFFLYRRKKAHFMKKTKHPSNTLWLWHRKILVWHISLLLSDQYSIIVQLCIKTGPQTNKAIHHRVSAVVFWSLPTGLRRFQNKQSPLDVWPFAISPASP